MRITKDQYDKAKASIPKLVKAQETVKEWEKAVEGETREVSQINVTPLGTEVTYKKETKRVEGSTGSRTT